MDIKGLSKKIKEFTGAYRFVLIVAVVGIALLLWPGSKEKDSVSTAHEMSAESLQLDSKALAEILETVQGAGRVEVMLSVAFGEQTVYQTDRDISNTSTGTAEEVKTVIITDSGRGENGLVSQTNPPVYMGAIVVCEGGDSPSVRLAITQAVAKITGLGADDICVLKMK